MKKKGLSKMEKQMIAEKTSELLTQFGYDSESDTYIDISKLAVSVGFKVGVSKQLHFKDDGFMSVSKDKKKLLIGVNDDRTIEEKRFIVAHELAHYFLHYIDSDLEEAIMHREHIKGKNEDENDADYFAACILMPKQSFVKQFQKLKAKKYDLVDIIDCLQAVFKTPRESIKRRIEEVCE